MPSTHKDDQPSVSLHDVVNSAVIRPLNSTQNTDTINISLRDLDTGERQRGLRADLIVALDEERLKKFLSVHTVFVDGLTIEQLSRMGWAVARINTDKKAEEHSDFPGTTLGLVVLQSIVDGSNKIINLIDLRVDAHTKLFEWKQSKD